MGEEQKDFCHSFCPETFTNVGINPNAVKFQDNTSCQSQIIELGPRAPQKNWFLWSSPHKIEVMIVV